MSDTITKAAWLRLAALLVCVQLFALGLLSALIIHQQRNLLLDLAASQVAVLTSDIDLSARTGQQNGLSLAEETMLQPLLHRLQAAMPEIRGAEIFSFSANAASVLYAVDEKRIGQAAAARATLLSKRNPALWRESRENSLLEVGRQLADDRDRPVGGYAVLFDGSATEAHARKAQDAFLPAVALAMAGAALATALGLALLAYAPVAGMLSRIARNHQIFAVALLVTLGSSAALALHATHLFSTELQPALEAKAGSVAGFLERKLARAMELGIPFDRIEGVDEYFADTLAEHREISALRLLGKGGAQIARAGSAQALRAASRPGAQGVVGRDFSIPEDGTARIEVVTNPDHIAQSMRAIVADMAIVLLVALIVFNEALRAMLARLPAEKSSAEADAGQYVRGNRLAAIRLPLFLFILTEELTRSFLPLHIRELASSSAATGLFGANTATGLPMTVYMIFFALATPFSGMLADRHGATRIFVWGALLTALGFGWATVTTDFWQFTVTRALCATGYAMATMACQRLILADSDPANRAQGLALLIGAVGVAAICGSSIGGVLAERAGVSAVFALSAALGLLVLVIFIRLQQGGAPESTRPVSDEPSFAWRDIGSLLARGRFALVMLTAAIPAKIVLAGFLFFLVPLALANSGYPPAAIGRAVMIYFILVAFITPLASRISDRYGLRLSPVVAGGVTIGLGGIAGWLAGDLGNDIAIIIGIAALGIGTGISAASLQALANEVGTEDGRIGQMASVAAFRTIERLGSAIGPVLAGILLGWWAFGGVMTVIGCMILAATLLFAIVFRRGQQHA
jgi:MFS family permease